MATVQKNIDFNTVTFSDDTVAEFFFPNETHLGLALTAMRKDPLAMVDVIVDNCLKTGNKDELKENLAYARQLSVVMDQLFGKQKATLEFDTLEDKPVTVVTFENGLVFLLKKCDRKTYSESRAKSAQSPLQGLKYVIKSCMLPDDGIDPATFKNPGILLGLSEVMDEYLEDTGKRLGNS